MFDGNKLSQEVKLGSRVELKFSFESKKKKFHLVLYSPNN